MSIMERLLRYATTYIQFAGVEILKIEIIELINCLFQGVRYTAVEGMVSEVKQPIFEANCKVLLCEFHVQKNMTSNLHIAGEPRADC